MPVLLKPLSVPGALQELMCGLVFCFFVVVIVVWFYVLFFVLFSVSRLTGRLKNRIGHDTTVWSLSPAVSFLLQHSELTEPVDAGKMLYSVDLYVQHDFQDETH